MRRNILRPFARNKFRAQKTVVDGLKFDSKREAKRWCELKLMERAGTIADLERQIRYVFEVNGVRVCAYIADFRYRLNGSVVVEDCKGFRTPEYKLKRKLMMACHGIDILET
jgi:hypothetical protein